MWMEMKASDEIGFMDVDVVPKMVWTGRDAENPLFLGLACVL